MKNPIIIAIDGHDGSGKTTIAHLLSKRINAKYIKPFSDSLGDLIAWLHVKGDNKFLNEIAIAAISKQIEENQGVEHLVFDRHWLSIFTILPEEYYNLWIDKPITILCWADVKTVEERLKLRSGNEVDEWCHEYYCKRYKELAEKYGVFIVNTSGDSKPEDRVNEIMKHLSNLRIIKS
ncbi:MAG: hypothetical protein ACM3KR_03925 [Deltaproteobacteria bacterium]